MLGLIRIKINAQNNTPFFQLYEQLNIGRVKKRVLLNKEADPFCISLFELSLPILTDNWKLSEEP